VAVKVTVCPVFEGFELDAKAVVVLALFTVWMSAADVLPLKLLSPAYWAVIECPPTERLVVEKVATPFELRAADPSAVPPSRNCTVPVGFAAPEDGVTVVVKVTAWPYVDVLAEEVTAMVVPIWVTLWTSTADVLPA